MEITLAKDLLESLTPHVVGDLERFADHEIGKLHKQLETCTTDQMKHIQGQISSYKHLKFLRTQVEEIVKYQRR